MHILPYSLIDESSKKSGQSDTAHLEFNRRDSFLYVFSLAHFDGLPTWLIKSKLSCTFHTLLSLDYRMLHLHYLIIKPL